LYLVDGDLRITQANPIAVAMFGDIPGGLIGSDFQEIVRSLWEPARADEILAIFRRTLETGVSHDTAERAELRIDRGFEEYYEWRLDRIALPDGSLGLVCYFRDVSAQVAARKAVEESREALRDADHRKDEFLAILAHELRNPLAPLRNSLELVRLAGSDRRALQRIHEVMERQVDHLVRLVDDLMDVSRITRGKVELRKEISDLGAVLGAALETSRPVIEARRHQLDVELPSEPLPLRADLVRLTQVFVNLLNNAAKFTPEGGRIWVSATRDVSYARVTIRDSGRGI
jgi:signal transduction histidine kinase